jgi:alkaline phosphatase D
VVASGYFNVYGNAARKDKHDFVVHLGDYIYESARGGEKAHAPPNLLFSLYDYRTRHGQVSQSHYLIAWEEF